MCMWQPMWKITLSAWCMPHGSTIQYSSAPVRGQCSRFYHTSQVMAALRGRAYVIPDDVKYLTTVTLSHRIIPKAESSLRGASAEQALREVIDSVAVPVENENMTR